MSSELENQIKDDLFRDKLNNFFSRYKKYLTTLLILLITIPSFYHAYKTYERNKSEKNLENYSKAYSLLKNKNFDESKIILTDLLKSNNEFVIILALNKIIEININNNDLKKNILIIDNILESKKLSSLNSDLLKIKKALLIFDFADEKLIENLLNNKNEKNKFNKISLQILYDFYNSKNLLEKARQIEKLINEK